MSLKHHSSKHNHEALKVNGGRFEPRMLVASSFVACRRQFSCLELCILIGCRLSKPIMV